LAGCDGAEQVPKRVEPSTIEDRVSEAARTWETLRNSASLADLEAFATRYKDTYFAGLAKARIDDIKRTQVTSKSYTYKSGDYQKRAEAETAQQATKKKAEDDARAKEEAERKRLAMLQQNDERKRTEVEAAKKRAETAGAMQAGSVFRDCPECPEMVVVPAGEFDLRAPVQSKVVTIKPFAVGKFEVTFAEWAACVAGGGCEANTNPDDKGWGRGKRPVINVSWDDATQYTAWLSKATGKSYRLLREAEWAYAALGVTKSPAPQTRFATGATISTANFSSDKTVEVGSFPGNAFGLHDLHGNVWEWVQDCYYHLGPRTGGWFSDYTHKLPSSHSAWRFLERLPVVRPHHGQSLRPQRQHRLPCCQNALTPFVTSARDPPNPATPSSGSPL
jgi:formylglycine-generating enzyme required for sulfatase activity